MASFHDFPPQSKIKDFRQPLPGGALVPSPGRGWPSDSVVGCGEMPLPYSAWRWLFDIGWGLPRRFAPRNDVGGTLADVGAICDRPKAFS